MKLQRCRHCYQPLGVDLELCDECFRYWVQSVVIFAISAVTLLVMLANWGAR